MKLEIKLEGLGNISKKIDNYASKIKTAKKNTLVELQDRAVKYAKENIENTTHLYTGELKESIKKRPITGNKAEIYSNSEYAKYVEYGTGVVGKHRENNHPLYRTAKLKNWKYGTYSGKNGWWYPTDAKDPNPSKYITKNGTYWAFTSGEAAHRFMYDAQKRINAEKREVLLNNLKKEGLKK